MCKNREGRVKSLAPFLPLTGAGVRVNFRRIYKGDTPNDRLVKSGCQNPLQLQCFFLTDSEKVLRNGSGIAWKKHNKSAKTE